MCLWMFCDCRQEGQGSANEIRGRDFRKELEDREKATREKRDRSGRGKDITKEKRDRSGRGKDSFKREM